MTNGRDDDLTGRIASLARGALDWILPPRCLACGTVVDETGTLCADCWGRLTLISDPICRVCGIPLPVDPGGDPVCGACFAEPPSFARARAGLVYDDASRPLILGFKHADRTHAVRVLARLALIPAREILAEADLVAPVPLHRWRLFRRRYNQSALLAGALAKATGREHVPDLLERVRATRTQGGLDRRQRERNVAGAMRVRAQHRDRVMGKAVVVVDDVITTGATVSACATALKRAGAARVDVIAAARVV